MQNRNGWGSSLDAPATPTAPAPRSVGHRLFGGPPLAVLVRLLFVSLVVGAAMLWLDIQPADLLHAVARAFERVWDMGFGALDRVGRTLVAGALVVVPVWLLTRLFTTRGRS